MNRRLRDRVPQVFQLKKRKLPQLVLVIAATVFISPTALAQVQTGQAKPVFKPAIEATKSLKPSSTFTKEYSADELAQKGPPANPVIDLSGRIMAELTEVFKQMTANQRGADQRETVEKIRSKQMSKDQYLLGLAALKDHEGVREADGKEKAIREANVDRVRTYLSGETQAAASDRVKTKINLLDKFNKGVSFDLDLGNVFAGAKSEPKSGEVRYGLILEEINPVPAPGRAAISDTQDELRFAGHADVKWTIGPVSEEHGRKLFNLETAAVEPVEERPSIWSRLRKPKPEFKGKITPKNFSNLAKVNSDDGPQWEIQAGQSEGYYNLVYLSKTSGEQISAEHQFKVPVAGTVELGRRFDDNFNVIQTSAYNILYDKRLPLVSVHYMNMEQRYAGEAQHAFGKGKRKRVGIRTMGVATGEKTPYEAGTEDDIEYRKEKYSLTYTEEF